MSTYSCFCTLPRRAAPLLLALLLGLPLLTSRPLRAQNLVALTGEAPAGPAGVGGTQAIAVLISGHVLGPDGLALSGATAQIEGSREVVVTNADGEFLLNAQFGQGPVRLVCRYAGYDDLNLTLAARPSFPLVVEMVKTVKQPLPVTGQLRDL